MIKNLKQPFFALVLVLFVTIVWTRLGWFGQMPVGGDATRFGLGLMSEMTRALNVPRVPTWNSLWGYGFPGLAESQIGFYYLPHFVIYSIFSLEYAYTWDISLHAMLAAFGVFLLSRQLGSQLWSSSFGAIVFVCSGFFLVHEPHHWGMVTGAWIPWIFLSALRLTELDKLRFSQKIRRTLLFAICLTMPVLTGHFQLGFIGMVSVLIWLISASLTGYIPRKCLTSGIPFWMAAPALALMLSLAQVFPTFQLAQLANQQRDWEYLSGFAMPPTHLAGLLMPAFGRTVSFWRPLLWDQFHTSPEELLFYVGILPLWLSVVAVCWNLKSSKIVQSLFISLVCVLILAMGPYFPCFEFLIQIPGFSFFRAPARWTLAATLIFSILSTMGLELVCHQVKQAARSLRRFCFTSLFLMLFGLIILQATISVTLAQTSGMESPFLSVINSIRSLMMPRWDNLQKVEDWVQASRQFHESMISSYAKPYTRTDLVSFTRDRWVACAYEVGPQALLILFMALGSFLVKTRRGLITLIMMGFGADLLLLSSLRSIEFAPLGPVTQQSPLLNKIEEFASGQDWPLAVSGDLGNLPMAVGASPIRAYRTLDLPVMPELDLHLSQPFDNQSLDAARLAGVGLFVFDPPAWRQIRGRWQTDQVEFLEIQDQTLWAWLTTKKLAAREAYPFGLAVLKNPIGRAWRISQSDLSERLGIRDFKQTMSRENWLGLATLAAPLRVIRRVPEEIRLSSKVETKELWVIAQLDVPGWKATLTDATGRSQPLEIIRLEGGWQALEVNTTGDVTVDLSYEPAYAALCQGISLTSWMMILVLFVVLTIRQTRRGGIQSLTTYNEPVG